MRWKNGMNFSTNGLVLKSIVMKSKELRNAIHVKNEIIMQQSKTYQTTGG